MIDLLFAAMGVGLSTAGAAQQGAAMKSANRRQYAEALRQQAIIDGNVAMAGRREAFDLSGVMDRVDDATAGQTAYYSAANIDPSSGSPALMQALAAEQGAKDMALVSARAGEQVAEMRGQGAAIASRSADTARALQYGAATAALNNMGQWMQFGTRVAQRGGNPFGTAFGGSGMVAGGGAFPTVTGNLY